MDRKNELLDRALQYFLEHGVSDLSLRPLAAEIGTSARLLIYHFGSKDELIAAVVEAARLRAQDSFTAFMAGGSRQGALASFWAWTTHPENSPFIRLLFAVQILAIQNPTTYARYLDATSSSWLTLIESALPPSPDRRATATLCAAVIDGLMLEYLSTGDLHRTTDALNIFASLLKIKSRDKTRKAPALSPNQ